MSKLTDKQALELWRRYNEGLAKNIDVDESLSRYDIDKKRAELEADPIAWILYFFPSFSTKASSHKDSAFTHETPTPCKPPETL